jgi:hypothetical protein
VGAVDDSDVRVAIVSAGSKARLFFCGGSDSVADKTHWFNVNLSDEQRDELHVTEQGFELRARFADGEVSGEYAVQPAAAQAFSSKLVDDATAAGLYEGLGQCGRLGLIATQASKGDEIETQGACVGPGHTPEQVNPIEPVSFQQKRVGVKDPGGEQATVLLHQAGLQPL